jgi:hypothetical protein
MRQPIEQLKRRFVLHCQSFLASEKDETNKLCKQEIISLSEWIKDRMIQEFRQLLSQPSQSTSTSSQRLASKNELSDDSKGWLTDRISDDICRNFLRILNSNNVSYLASGFLSVIFNMDYFSDDSTVLTRAFSIAYKEVKSINTLYINIFSAPKLYIGVVKFPNNINWISVQINVNARLVTIYDPKKCHDTVLKMKEGIKLFIRLEAISFVEVADHLLSNWTYLDTNETSPSHTDSVNSGVFCLLHCFRSSFYIAADLPMAVLENWSSKIHASTITEFRTQLKTLYLDTCPERLDSAFSYFKDYLFQPQCYPLWSIKALTNGLSFQSMLMQKFPSSKSFLYPSLAKVDNCSIKWDRIKAIISIVPSFDDSTNLHFIIPVQVQDMILNSSCVANFQYKIVYIMDSHRQNIEFLTYANIFDIVLDIIFMTCILRGHNDKQLMGLVNKKRWKHVLCKWPKLSSEFLSQKNTGLVTIVYVLRAVFESFREKFGSPFQEGIFDSKWIQQRGICSGNEMQWNKELLSAVDYTYNLAWNNERDIIHVLYLFLNKKNYKTYQRQVDAKELIYTLLNKRIISNENMLGMLEDIHLDLI